MTTPTSTQPARDDLGRLATPEHLLSVVEQLAAKWRKHQVTATTSPRYEREYGMAAAYCKSLAILLDQPYGAVYAALENGELR